MHCRKSHHRTLFVVTVVVLALGVVACGRMGLPVAPEGSTYPATYPQQ